MPAASWDHAVTIMNLILLLAPVAQALGGRVLTAPLDVFFASADPVQPESLCCSPNRWPVARIGVSKARPTS